MVAACLEAHAATVLLQGAAAAQAGCTFLAASLPLMHLACLSASGTAQARLAAVQLATQLSQRRGYASAEQVNRAQSQLCSAITAFQLHVDYLWHDRNLTSVRAPHLALLAGVHCQQVGLHVLMDTADLTAGCMRSEPLLAAAVQRRH